MRLYVRGDIEKAYLMSGEICVENVDVLYYGENRVGKIRYHKGWNGRKFYYSLEINEGEKNSDRIIGDSIIDLKKKVLDYFKTNPVPENQKQNKVKVELLPEGENSDFYPTPKWMVGQMISMVNMSNVSSVLEPSAGKGDILEGLEGYGTSHAKFGGKYYKRDKKYDIDVIELDENLRYILDGKGYRVVHDDFETYHTNKSYDLIIMNPPFSRGVDHILIAMAMQEQTGGQLVTLCNAETLLNPYNDKRKLLLQKIEESHAVVKYVKNAFKNGERKTDVQTAIIYVNYPRSGAESHIYEDMRKAYDSYRGIEDNGVREVATASKVDTLIRLCEIETASTMKLYDEYLGISKMCGGCVVSMEMKNHDIPYRVRQKYWKQLLDLPEIKSKCTTEMRREYQNLVEKMADYEFSEFNVRKVMLDIQEKLFSGVDDEIMKLFEKLSAQFAWFEEGCKNIHYFNGWKTNMAHKVNYKCIVPANGMFSWGDSKKISWYQCYGFLADMEKALNFLDTGLTSEPCNLEERLQKAEENCECRNIRCKYFDVSFYRKGTCHIMFRPETYRLVDALNIYAAKNRGWLPPNYGKKHYCDMTHEEKQVVDDFQGEKDYEKVMDNPKDYIVERSEMMLLT